MQQYHKKSGDRSLRHMSGLMIHRSRNTIEKQWNELRFGSYRSFRDILQLEDSSRCGICFYRICLHFSHEVAIASIKILLAWDHCFHTQPSSFPNIRKYAGAEIFESSSNVVILFSNYQFHKTLV